VIQGEGIDGEHTATGKGKDKPNNSCRKKNKVEILSLVNISR
jgi:hypothetical protein